MTIHDLRCEKWLCDPGSCLDELIKNTKMLKEIAILGSDFCDP